MAWSARVELRRDGGGGAVRVMHGGGAEQIPTVKQVGWVCCGGGAEWRERDGVRARVEGSPGYSAFAVQLLAGDIAPPLARAPPLSPSPSHLLTTSLFLIIYPSRYALLPLYISPSAVRL